MLGGNVYRKKALDRLATPDELDRLLVVVHGKAWIPLLTLVLLCTVALAWSLWGGIPVTVNGQGVLINPGNVKPIQSQDSGQLVVLSLRPGQQIAKGQVIGQLTQADLRNQLEQASAKLEELIDTDTACEKLEATRWELEKKSNDAQRAFLREETANLKKMAADILQRGTTFRKTQRNNLSQTKQLSQKLHGSLGELRRQVDQLGKEGLMGTPQLVNVEHQFTESALRLANIDVQVRELDLRDIEAAEKHLEQQNRISDLTMQLQQLDVAEQRLQQQLLESSVQREAQINDTRRQIKRLRPELERKSRIKSEFSGRVLEVTVSTGQLVRAGDRLGTMELDGPKSELRNLAYFGVRDGKRIKPGMRIHVTPTTVQREREGAIVGRVTKVSSFPITRQSAANLVGNEEIAALLTRSGGMIEVEADLERDPNSFSGYRWTSKGPRLLLSAGTTTTLRVTLEQRRPITYVLPILRTWVYGARDEEPEGSATGIEAAPTWSE